MQPWRGSWTVLAATVACTPPTTPEPGKPPPGESVARAEPARPEPVATVTTVTPTPKVAPTPSGESLDDRPVVASKAGAWELRSLGPGGGSDGGPKGGGGDGEGGFGSGGGIGSAGGAPRPASAPAPASGGAYEAEADRGRGGPQKAMKPDARAEASPLKAGSTDDNADFKGYLKFLATWTGRSDVRGEFQPLDVADRVFVRVVDGDRRPVPGAKITVTDPATKATLWQATTYGDGAAPYYPRLFGPNRPAAGTLAVAASVGAETVTQAWDGAADVTLAAQAPRAAAGMGLDVLFLVDTTGSMGDELERIKTSLLAVSSKVQGRREDLSVRWAAVAYKDTNDEYVTMAHPFTADVAAFDAALKALTAGGGGDLPESLNQGLARAVDGMQWRPEAAKVVFLVADAAPQMRLKGDTLYGDSAVKAVGLGIRLHAVAASGLDPLGTLVLRQLAQLTRGKFIFIEYGGTQATAAKHGVAGPVQGGNNLDEILLAQLTAEIDGWGK